ncbi:Ankzf1 [Symbiodinium sp. KB8]|nr:Ankzf1 [Symbiodinium sp. KB8]
MGSLHKLAAPVTTHHDHRENSARSNPHDVGSSTESMLENGVASRQAREERVSTAARLGMALQTSNATILRRKASALAAGRLMGDQLAAAGKEMSEVAAGAAAAAFQSAVSAQLGNELSASIAAESAGQAAGKAAKMADYPERGRVQAVADAATTAGKKHGLSQDSAAASGAMAAGHFAAGEASSDGRMSEEVAQAAATASAAYAYGAGLATKDIATISAKAAASAAADHAVAAGMHLQDIQKLARQAATVAFNTALEVYTSMAHEAEPTDTPMEDSKASEILYSPAETSDGVQAIKNLTNTAGDESVAWPWESPEHALESAESLPALPGEAGVVVSSLFGEPGQRGSRGGPQDRKALMVHRGHMETRGPKDYYQEVLGKMETSLGRKHRAVNNDLVLLNRQAALYHARDAGVRHGATGLHAYILRSYARIAASLSQALRLDHTVSGSFAAETPRQDLKDARKLLLVARAQNNFIRHTERGSSPQRWHGAGLLEDSMKSRSMNVVMGWLAASVCVFGLLL